MLNSNRNPVETSLSYEDYSLETTQIFDYKNTNWKAFQNYLNENINLNFHIKTTQQLEQRCSEFTECLDLAIQMYVLQVELRNNSHIFSDDMKSLLKLKNKMRKVSQKGPTSFNKGVHEAIEKILYKTIKKSNAKKIENFI